MRLTKKVMVLMGFYLFCVNGALAESMTVKMYQVTAKGQGKEIGTIKVEDTEYGALLTANLTRLSPGVHGFHIHEKANCGDKGMAAGDHFDPKETGKHAGPYMSEGHQGDLPALVVDKNGKATSAMLAPKVKMADLKGHALMIHAGGDNYSDNPHAGGGGTRVACGVVE